MTITNIKAGVGYFEMCLFPDYFLPISAYFLPFPANFLPIPAVSTYFLPISAVFYLFPANSCRILPIPAYLNLNCKAAYPKYAGINSYR